MRSRKVRTVGSGSYTALTSVSFTPFPVSQNGTDHESHVTITEDTTDAMTGEPTIINAHNTIPVKSRCCSNGVMS